MPSSSRVLSGPDTLRALSGPLTPPTGPHRPTSATLNTLEITERGNQDVFAIACPAWSPPPTPATTSPSFLKLGRPMATTATPQNDQGAALVATVAGLIQAREALNRARQRGPKGVAKLNQSAGAVAGGVLLGWGRTPSSPVAVDNSNAGLDELPGGRFAAKAVFEAMLDGGLLAYQPGVRWDRGFGFGEGFGGLRARYWPTLALLSLAEGVGVTAASVKSDFDVPPPTAIPKVRHPVTVSTIKQRREKEARPLPLTALGEPAGALVEEVTAWNTMAAATPVTGCRPPRWTRAFGPDVKLGGGLYAVGSQGYQTMSGAGRLNIRIAGQAVYEADVHAAALSILHGLLHLPLPSDDLYNVQGVPRVAVKAWVIQTLGLGSFRTRWTVSTDDAVKQLKARVIGEQVCQRFPFMRAPAQAVAAAAGLDRLAEHGPPELLLTHRLAAIQAAAMGQAMATLRDRFGSLTLPVHDSLICPESVPQAAAVKAIQDAFEAVVGVRVRVRVSASG